MPATLSTSTSSPQSSPSVADLSIEDWVATARLGGGPWCDCLLARPAQCPADWPADYVLKQLKPKWRNDPMVLRQICREAQLAKDVSHPNLSALLAANVQTALPYMVFPYIDGVSVRTLLDRQTQLPIAIALWVVRQASDALQVVHQAGFRHADIKPANLLVANNWHVTLIDLGLAQPLCRDADYHQQWLAGSMGYAAPELFSVGTEVTEKADVYSLGVTLYELITGKRPDASVSSQFDAERFSPPDGRFLDLKSACPSASAELSRLVREMLALPAQGRPAICTLISRLRRLEMFHLAERTA
ncbi:MAG: serine/threonine-protein kinase [Pirellulaceae bacterium]|nr:serine/threonine protein kinase [Planctomycetota bacterium]